MHKVEHFSIALKYRNYQQNCVCVFFFYLIKFNIKSYFDYWLWICFLFFKDMFLILILIEIAKWHFGLILSVLCNKIGYDS